MRGWTVRSDEDEKKAVEEPKASDETKKLTVETVSNHIYFYADVDSDRCLALMKTIRDTDQMLRNEAVSRDLPQGFPPVPIWLHVYSGGGSPFAGLGVADQLRRIKTPIYSVVEGYCASAATFISMSCTKRFITPSAYILIHQLSGFTWGTYSQIKDDVHLFDMVMDRFVGFYTGASNLDEKQVREMLGHESWFDADECLEKGFVDEVMV